MAGPDRRKTRPCKETRFGYRTYRKKGGGTAKRLWDFLRGVPITSKYLNEEFGDIFHVSHTLWQTLQFLMFYRSVQIREARYSALRGIYEEMRRAEPKNTFLFRLRGRVREERLQYFGSLMCVCHPQRGRDPKDVATIWRVCLTLALLEERYPTPLSGMFAQFPEAVRYVEPQWRERFMKQVELGTRFWEEYGKTLELEYWAYDTSTVYKGRIWAPPRRYPDWKYRQHFRRQVRGDHRKRCQKHLAYKTHKKKHRR